jgi:hypothetical protein
LSLHTEFLPLFENAALLRKILTWGRESSRQVRDLKILHLPAAFDDCTHYVFVTVMGDLRGVENKTEIPQACK